MKSRVDSRKSGIVAADVRRLTLKKANGTEPPYVGCYGFLNRPWPLLRAEKFRLILRRNSRQGLARATTAGIVFQRRRFCPRPASAVRPASARPGKSYFGNNSGQESQRASRPCSGRQGAPFDFVH